MADGHDNATSNTVSKRKENVRVFIRRRRRRTTQCRKSIHLQSASSTNSHETILSSANDVNELVSLIERKINTKPKKNSRSNKNIIVVNYKPVFVNSKRENSSKHTKATSTLLSNPKPVLNDCDDDDDNCSSATHYSRQRSFTATSSDGSPAHSSSSCSYNQPSVPLDVPDVEDPLKFIEIMYQQLFTEDGQLRSGSEPITFANCVKQIVTNSRRNSTSSVIGNGSTLSQSKTMNFDTNSYHKKHSTSSNYNGNAPKLSTICLSPHVASTNRYNGVSSEEEQDKESETLKQINNPQQKVMIDNNLSRKNLEKLNKYNNSQMHSSLNPYHMKKSTTNRMTTNNICMHMSKDDTGSEDLDTFSDLDYIHYHNPIIQQSPSIDDDFTPTDSKQLSSGYQSLDRSKISFEQQKSHSENDTSYYLDKNNINIKSIQYCSNYLQSSNSTVISPVASTPLSFSAIIKRIQEPIGKILMKYVNFILISKNVLILPLFIFLLRQRSIHVGN